MSASTIARAQVNAEAEQLFRDGKQLMSAKRYGEACDAFATSQRLEPHIATLMSLADCREKNGQLATAWALFLEAEQQTRNVATQVDLHATSEGRATALESRLSYLTINVPDESRIEGLVVTHDEVAVDPGLWNRAIPVDGGDHVIEGRAPGHEPWSTRITVATEQDRQAVEVPKFKELPRLVRAETVAVVEPDARLVSRPERAGVSRRNRYALISASAGTLMVVTGVVLWANALSMEDEALSHCPTGVCDPEYAAAAAELYDRAQQRSIMANVALGIGAVGIGIGTYLWLTDDPGEGKVALTPQVGGGVTGLALGGRF